MKKALFAVFIITVFSLVFAGPASAKFSEETGECLECHSEGTMGIVKQWDKSNHWNAGVGCYECHKAEEGDVDAMDHNGFTIAIITCILVA